MTQDSGEEELDVSEHRAIEKFFYSHFVPFIRKYKIGIMVIFSKKKKKKVFRDCRSARD